MFTKEKDDGSLLGFMSLIPAIALFLYLVINLGYEFFLQYNYYNKRVSENRENFLEHRKDIIKNRVDFIVKITEFKRKWLSEENAKREVLKFVNSTSFSNGGYVFIYELLDINGGEKFARMIANPNRKDLVGKYISDSYKDAKGNMFRKEFLKGIREKGESFATYYYKKPNENKISKKISYFKLDKQWNWVIATGIYLDKEEEIVEIESNLLKETLKNKIILSILVSGTILIIALYVSSFLKKLLQQRFDEYKESIALNEKELHNKNRLLIKQLYTDSLTLKRNRNALERDLRENSNTCMTIVDIDNFRWLNDLYGTKNGNVILKKMASILEEFKKLNNLKCNIYRIGSDQFVLLSSSTKNVEQIEELTKKLENFISEYKIYLDKVQWISINTTIGVSCEKSDLLSTADMALNRAKVTRSKHVIYSKSIDRRELNKKIFEIKRKVEEALKTDRIAPFFQPIANRNRQIVKYEVLVRISDKDRYLAPNEFLEISKMMKLYPEISKNVIKKSFDYFRNKDIEFSINLSIVDIKNDSTISFLENEFKKDKELLNKITIEILESENIDDIKIFNDFINKVREYGVKIAIDDFGSGYSSFSNLLIIKPDIIKIDSSIIKDVDKDKDKQALVKAIVATSKILNSITIAEYVSTKSIFETLVNLGVDQFQGYYIGKPSDKV